MKEKSEQVPTLIVCRFLISVKNKSYNHRTKLFPWQHKKASVLNCDHSVFCPQVYSVSNNFDVP